jgi:hypothetical protein
MTTFTIERGERFVLTIVADNGASDIDLNDGYEVDAWIKSSHSGSVYESMSPTIDNQGRAVIDYDTINLRAGAYLFDIRFTKAGADAFTTEAALIVGGTITPPSPR